MDHVRNSPKNCPENSFFEFNADLRNVFQEKPNTFHSTLSCVQRAEEIPQESPSLSELPGFSNTSSLIFSSSTLTPIQIAYGIILELANAFKVTFFSFQPSNNSIIASEIILQRGALVENNKTPPSVPKEIIDPFTNQIFMDPVKISRNGTTHYFERSFIRYAVEKRERRFEFGTEEREKDSKILDSVFGNEPISMDQFSDAPEMQHRVVNWLRDLIVESSTEDSPNQ